MTVAKRRLQAGESLDGEGGFTVYGRRATASQSLARGALPIGLARGARPGDTAVEPGAVVRWQDVTIDDNGGPAARGVGGSDGPRMSGAAAQGAARPRSRLRSFKRRSL